MDNNYLYHHGVKGMKWGVRKKRAPAHEDYRKAHDKKDVREMSDAELRERNNRLLAERQYQQMTKKTSKGKKVVMGCITAFTATAATIAAIDKAMGTYSKVGSKIASDVAPQALDKIGDFVVNSINLSGPWTS